MHERQMYFLMCLVCSMCVYVSSEDREIQECGFTLFHTLQVFFVAQHS